MYNEFMMDFNETYDLLTSRGTLMMIGKQRLHISYFTWLNYMKHLIFIEMQYFNKARPQYK